MNKPMNKIYKFIEEFYKKEGSILTKQEQLILAQILSYIIETEKLIDIIKKEEKNNEPN